ncbi:MAG: primosomal protein N' [Rickettsiales bacterium]|nr:primosomal protein N' [Rickettsiales bacterium]
MSKIFAQVLLPLALDEPFSYLAEEPVECGDVVRVEFGRKEIWGVVVGTSKTPPEKISENKIKKILEINSRLKLSENQLKFIETIASYNLGSRGLVLRAFIGILNSDKVKKIPEGLVQKVEPENFHLKKLLPKQQEVFDELRDKTPPVSLLDGVTGSGKTEIYFALIAKILAEKPSSQILILLPEIALTSQLLLRFEEQFKFPPALWHSKISKKDKREIFYGVTQGSVRVLIGARSALLLPFKNLQLIVVDEEHDTSFKQEDVFNFHARDMCVVKAKLENFPVILSSATPAVETYANAVLGKYHHFILEQRFGQKNDIELVDLRREKMQSNEFLSQKLRSEMALNLAKNKQTLLFLNRRGYAPVTLCKTCGKKYQCGDCDFHLVLHKSKQKLICHHCGHQEKSLLECKFCGEKDALISVGVGVEKVEEEVRRIFPTARIALVTSDNVTSFDEVDKLVKQILNREIDVIIGTQMIAKGHDFPDLNLVGIIDADAMLYSSELRALEKTYQILTQVIGRAGRRDECGKIVIQTFNPQNFIFEKIVKSDKKNFYEFEIKNRETMELPPFSRLAKFEISSFSEGEAKNFAKKLISHFPVSDKIELFGPAPAPLQRLKNRHHFLVNLKTSKKTNLQKLISDVISTLEVPKSVRIRIDVDPVN